MKVAQRSGADGPGPERSRVLRGSRRLRFQRALLEWYRAHGRPLRIRATREPWPILVSEVMAQQTQISRVDEAWVGFMARYPTPAALAAASPAEVLRAWQGLGYNRRAVTLRRAAQTIVERHHSRVPASVDALEALAGVGPYTARAVAALAFERPVAAVDTNVRRVLVRVLGMDLRAAELQAVADPLVYRADPAAWSHAMMELGATVCRPRSPDCGSCPISRWCASADAVGRSTATRDTDAGTASRSPSESSTPSIPFEHTSRWLRGRIVERLRDQEDGAWAALPDAVGRHGPDAIDRAVAALQRDGLLERHADGRVRLPSSMP
jgi:A/G-specific adenine glycosylase